MLGALRYFSDYRFICQLGGVSLACVGVGRRTEWKTVSGLINVMSGLVLSFFGGFMPQQFEFLDLPGVVLN